MHAQLERFKSNTVLLEGKIKKFNDDFGDGRIRAPINGLIGNKIAHIGEIIKPGDVIAEIDDVSDLYIVWHVPAFNIYAPKLVILFMCIMANKYFQAMYPKLKKLPRQR